MPLLVARAGRGTLLQLDETQDRFVAENIAVQASSDIINDIEAPFDLFAPDETSREIARWIVAFLRFHRSR